MSVTRLPGDTAVPGAAEHLLCALLAAAPAPGAAASPGDPAEENPEREGAAWHIREIREPK
jgi:hypothetical protein